MSLSNTAIAQREKEAKQLNTFLIYSLIGSLILHIGLITLSITKFLLRQPEIKDKPIEFTLLEEIPKLETKPPIKTKSTKQANRRSGGNSNNGKIAAKTKITNVAKSPIKAINKQPIIPSNSYFTPQQIANSITPKNIIKPVVKPIIKSDPIIPKPITKPIIEPEITPEPIIKPEEIIPKPINKTIIKPQTIIKPITPKPIIKPESSINQETTKIPSSKLPISENITSPIPTQLPENSFNDNGKLGNSGKNGFTKGTGNNQGNNTGNGTGNDTGNNTGNGTGNDTGNGTENSTKKDETPIITPSKPPTEIGTKLNPADCIRCDIKYPDRARRRRVEGNAEVAIDVDANGNITRVQLINSSGDSELDEAAEKAVKEWKLKPIEGGRQGVIAVVKFKMKK